MHNGMYTLLTDIMHVHVCTTVSKGHACMFAVHASNIISCRLYVYTHNYVLNNKSYFHFSLVLDLSIFSEEASDVLMAFGGMTFTST